MMIDTFYLDDIGVHKDCVNDTIRYIFEKSVLFNDSYLRKWLHFTTSEGRVIEDEKHLSLSYSNEIEFLKSLLSASAFYASTFDAVFHLQLSDIEQLAIDIQRDFQVLATVADNLRYEVSKRPAMRLLNRRDMLDELSLHLRRRLKNNIVLVGHSGVGKSFLVESFAREQKCPVLLLNISSLVSKTKYRGEFEDRVSSIFKIIAKYRLVVFIDEIHTVMGLGGGDGGGIALNNMLKAVIIDTNIRLIGATTEQEFLLMSEDKAFLRRFSVLTLKEISSEEVTASFEALLDNVLLLYPELMYQASDLVDYLNREKRRILNYLNTLSEFYYPSKLVDFLDCCAATYVRNRQIKDVHSYVNKYTKSDA